MRGSRPNIILIVLDTVRRDHLSLYGYERETSPRLDEFAADATTFQNAISAAQWTIPSHASMFTGLYPTSHRTTQGYSVLPRSHVTLAELLRLHGYHTVGFCNNPLVGVLENGLRRGFTEFFSYGGAIPVRPRFGKGTLDKLREAVNRRLLAISIPIQNMFARSDFLFRLSLNPLFVPIWSRLARFKGDTARSIDDAIRYLRAGPPEPYFMFINLMSAHPPYTPPRQFREKFAPYLAHDREARRIIRSFNADASRWPSPLDRPMSELEHRVLTDFYDAEIAGQDAELGRLLDELHRSGAPENSMVIITSDHGEGLGEHGFFGHGFVVYGELMNVPLIIKYPAEYPVGTRIKTFVSTRRLFHTVLDAAGIEPPDREDVREMSLAATAAGHDPEKHLFAEAIPPVTFIHVLEHKNPSLIDRLSLREPRRAVYRDRMKLAQVGGRVEGLFDVLNDPGEINDLSAEKPALVAELKQKLAEFIGQAEAKASPESTPHLDVEGDKKVAERLRALGYME